MFILPSKCLRNNYKSQDNSPTADYIALAEFLSFMGEFDLLQCVFEVDPESGLTLTELAEGVEVADIVQTVGCEFQVSPDLKPMQQVELPE